jgi:hypothetical protein
LEFGRVGGIIGQKSIRGRGMNEQEKPTLDDADGNCRQCGHPFNPHIVVAYDMSDFSKGGEVRCPAAGCSCFHSLGFDFKAARNSAISKQPTTL